MKRVLIVDDEEHVARTLKLSLDSMQRYEVRVESSGCRAVETARDFKPDLILLDVIMPDRSGVDVLRDIRNDSSLRNVPVVFLTATVPEHAAPEPDAWIAKPVTGSDVALHIDRQLARTEANTRGSSE